MTSAKEQNPLSDLDKDLLQGRFDVTRAAFVEREDDKDTIYGKASDWVSYPTIHDLFKKAIRRMKGRMIKQLGMKRQERWVQEKNFDKQTTKYGIARIFVI